MASIYGPIELLHNNTKKNLAASRELLKLASELTSLASQTKEKGQAQSMFSISRRLAEIGEVMLNEASETQSRLKEYL